MKRFLVSCLFFLAAGPYAAAAPTTNDFQVWQIVTGTGPLGMDGKLRWYLESQPRFGSDASGIERFLLRGAVGYKVLEHLSLWAGYGWTPTFMNAKYDPLFTDESRWWQQALYDHQLFGLDFVHRVRTEQRYIERVSGVHHRVRYMLRASKLLHTTEEATAVGVTGYNEIFLNLNGSDPGPEPGFDRNRFFIGPYIKKDVVRFELGYLGEYGRRRGIEDRMINALAVSMNFVF